MDISNKQAEISQRSFPQHKTLVIVIFSSRILEHRTKRNLQTTLDLQGRKSITTRHRELGLITKTRHINYAYSL